MSTHLCVILGVAVFVSAVIIIMLLLANECLKKASYKKETAIFVYGYILSKVMMFSNPNNRGPNFSWEKLFSDISEDILIEARVRFWLLNADVEEAAFIKVHFEGGNGIKKLISEYTSDIIGTNKRWIE